MKRFIAWLSVCAMLVCNLQVTASAQTTDSHMTGQENQIQNTAVTDQGAPDGTGMTQSTGDFTLTLHFSCPERTETIGNRQIRAALLDSEDHEVWSTSLVSDLSQAKQDTKDGFSAEVRYLNEAGEDLTTEAMASFFRADIQGLALNQNYHVRLTGIGYKSYTSEEFSLTTFSKQLVVNTGSTSFSLGDINSDDKVDEKDLESMTSELEKKESIADINGDGVVDITDVAYVHRQTNVKLGEAEFFDTLLIASNVAQVETDSFQVASEIGRAHV